MLPTTVLQVLTHWCALSHHSIKPQLPPQVLGTNSSPEQPWRWHFVCRNWTSHSSTEAWQHVTLKLGPTCKFTSAKNKRHEEQGGEVQSHTWSLLGQTSPEKALPNMCTWRAYGSSSQFHLVKPPQGNVDPQNDIWDYLGLLCDLYSTQNLYAGNYSVIYRVHPGAYSSPVIHLREKSF